MKTLVFALFALAAHAAPITSGVFGGYYYADQPGIGAFNLSATGLSFSSITSAPLTYCVSLLCTSVFAYSASDRYVQTITYQGNSYTNGLFSFTISAPTVETVGTVETWPNGAPLSSRFQTAVVAFTMSGTLTFDVDGSPVAISLEGVGTVSEGGYTTGGGRYSGQRSYTFAPPQHTPEPSTWGMIAGALGLLGIFQRLRRY